ncbi:hypothetical protein LWI29_014924 [Acer saccharum]|uniref:Uncharacterized protein n=1 Tax=Acer saccharum TaxID=4024 RepID=A0AA39RPP5_ACESA|nr:hypothetical protein LWI29_014924 [Acer saccharum]
MVDFDLGLGLVWVVVWWWWWLDFKDGDRCPRLGLDLGLVMGGFVVRRGGGKVVGGFSGQRQALRSGLAWKHSIDVGTGVTDADYRGLWV